MSNYRLARMEILHHAHTERIAERTRSDAKVGVIGAGMRKE